MEREKCKECRPKDLRKHGNYKVKEGNELKPKQRYICKKCGKTQSEHKVTYSKTEKRLFSFLLNFLENDMRKLDVKEFLTKSKEYRSGISDIEIKPYTEIDITDFGPRGTSLKVSCIKPRLVICEDDGKITLVKVPKAVADRYNRCFQLNIY